MIVDFDGDLDLRGRSWLVVGLMVVSVSSRGRKG